MNIFVGNLDYNLDEIEVIKLFALYGDVQSIKLIRDKETGESKGYAFIEMPKESEAKRAIEHVNGREVNGKKVVAHEAKPAEEYNREKEAARKKASQSGYKKPYDRGSNPRSKDRRSPSFKGDNTLGKSSFPNRAKRDFRDAPRDNSKRDFPPKDGFKDRR